MCWEMTGSCFIAPYVFLSAYIIRLTLDRCTLHISEFSHPAAAAGEKKSCNSHFFLGYHGITGDRVWFWNGRKTDPSLSSLWGTADWVSTVQETKQAKPKQKREPFCNRKIHFARLRKIVWHHCERAMVFMFTLKKTKHCTVPGGSFPDGARTPNPATYVKLRDPVHFLWTAGRGCTVHDGHGAASWKTNRHMWILHNED